MFLQLYPSDKLLYIPFEARHVESFTTPLKQSRALVVETIDKMALSRKSLAGPGFIILNVIRVMNIIGFLAVIAASIVMLIKTSAATHLFFFDALSHVITAVASMFLIASEVGVFARYFERNWPLLSIRHGFFTLGVAMIVIGITVMGNLNKAAGSEEDLGLAFWRMVIGAGILIFILGHINLIATFVFCDRKQGITAREVRIDGAAGYKTPVPSEGTPSAPVLAQTYISQPMTPPSGKSNPFRIFTSDRSRDSILPSYQTTTGSPTKEVAGSSLSASPTSKYSRTTDCTKKTMWSNFISGNRKSRMSLAPPLPINSSYHNKSSQQMSNNRSPEISGPMNVNPQFAHLVRPDSALHPSRSGESDPYRWKV